jgi:hypothetical protein
MIIDNLDMATKYDMPLAVLKRLVKGFIAGAVSSMVLVIPTTTSSFADVKFWLSALLIAGIFGGVTGVILAVEKWSQSWR